MPHKSGVVVYQSLTIPNRKYSYRVDRNNVKERPSETTTLLPTQVIDA
jgi:hypothetical protein